MWNFLEEWQWNAIKRLPLYFASIGGARVLKVGGQQCLTFRYLNPPMISKVHKTTCVLIFYIIHCCRCLLSWYRQLCSIDITIIAQKLTLRISPPKLPCPGTAPAAAINLKFWDNMPRFVLGKVRKFQDPSSSRWEIFKKNPEGWIKTTPLPLIGLIGPKSREVTSKIRPIAKKNPADFDFLCTRRRQIDARRGVPSFMSIQ